MSTWFPVALDACPGLVLREQLHDSKGSAYWQEWYCRVPPDGIPYCVTEQEWAVFLGDPLRRIFACDFEVPPTLMPLKVVMAGG